MLLVRLKKKTTETQCCKHYLASGKTKAMQSISQEKQTAPWCSVLLRNFSKGEPSEQILAEADTQHLFKEPQNTAPSSAGRPVCGQAHPWAHSFDPSWARKEAPAGPNCMSLIWQCLNCYQMSKVSNKQLKRITR